MSLKSRKIKDNKEKIDSINNTSSNLSDPKKITTTEKKIFYRPFSAEDEKASNKEGGEKSLLMTVFDVDKFKSLLNRNVTNDDKLFDSLSIKSSKNSKVDFILEEYSGALKLKIFKKIYFLLTIILVLVVAVFTFKLILDFRKNELREDNMALLSKNELFKINIYNNLIYRNQANDLNDKFKKVDRLVRNHIYWSNLFNFLEEKTLENVYYVNFESSGIKQINLQARTNSFDNLSRQFDSFNNDDRVEEVRINSANLISSIDGDYISFDIILIFKDDFFLR